jgi:demethylsterigmatocystin 6-O-methyltransferase
MRRIIAPANSTSSYDACGPTYQEMPAYFRRNGYKNLTDSYQTVWQDAWNTKENCFEWMMKRPDYFANFNAYMASRREHQTLWSDVYPLKDDATNLSPERAVFVDVGGGIGHQCADFKEKHPDVPGKVVLQDLPFAVEHAIPTPGVDNQPLDFFTGQPVKGTSLLKSSIHHPENV